ncbi:leucine-rich repeats and immunoglobulin-like domains protein 1 [Ruditapes philippinarum]|uniref:leucine-rich repeats and immunoglobulin-like domains protein 1 n=1 Tax=Ruditapes philippinarum TaxID=129788 RepID=UPI00295B844A|nr:leucine-rich repeats and immunoglobulin-like domains protein 1 [Ruditapes philippinarum]
MSSVTSSCIILFCMAGLNFAAQISIRGQTSLAAGDTLMLVCNGTDLQTPLSNLDWLKNDKTLSPDKRISIAVSSKLSDRTRNVSSNLSISHVTEQDAGRYTCKISNEMMEFVNVQVSGMVFTGRVPSGSDAMSLSATASLLLVFTVFFG